MKDFLGNSISVGDIVTRAFKGEEFSYGLQLGICLSITDKRIGFMQADGSSKFIAPHKIVVVTSIVPEHKVRKLKNLLKNKTNYYVPIRMDDKVAVLKFEESPTQKAVIAKAQEIGMGRFYFLRGTTTHWYQAPTGKFVRYSHKGFLATFKGKVPVDTPLDWHGFPNKKLYRRKKYKKNSSK